MGKLIYYISLLVFIDLLFIVTGQILSTGTPSISSIILNAILDLPNLTFSGFFRQLIGDIFNLANSTTGIMGLLGGIAGVTIGTLITKSDSLLWLSVIGASVGLLVSDFVFIFSYLASLNSILATMIMAPIIVVFVLILIDWSRGKD